MSPDALLLCYKLLTLKWPGQYAWCLISLGIDPRDYALLHLAVQARFMPVPSARELGVPKVLVPARPGITNALGCIVADLRHDFVNNYQPAIRQR